MQRTAVSVVAGLVLSVVVSGVASAAPVPLDTSFSGNGIVALGGSGYQFTSGLTTVGDAVYAYGGSSPSWSKSSRYQRIARYLPNGRLDQDFAGDGIKTLRYTENSNATDATVTADGKLLVIGWTNDGVVITKLRPNGSLDTSFGTRGVRKISIKKAAYSPQIEVTSTGQVVVAWSRIIDWDTDAGSVQFSRLRANGSLVHSFGRNGVRTVDIRRADLLKGLAIGPDDRLYASVWTEKAQQPRGSVSVISVAPNNHVWVRTLNPYGKHGTAPVGIGVDDTGRAVVGITPSNSPGVGAMRLDSDGTLDDTYSGDGVTKSKCTCYTNGAILTDDGMVVVGGNFDGDKSYAARFTTTGAFDATFSGGAVLWNLFAGQEFVSAAGVDASGRLLLGGSAGGKTGSAFVARFVPPSMT